MDRRTFVNRAGVAGIGLAWPRTLDALAHRTQDLDPGSAELWESVREAFPIPRDRIYLNVGTLGPQPRPVVDAIIEHTRRVAMTYPPGVDWNTLTAAAAQVLKCDPAGLVFPRNTTEGMNFVANGLELRPGDEVLTTLHEHIGGLCCWQLASARHGVTLRQLELPIPPSHEDEVVDIFTRTITPRTRVISISHVTFSNGLIMPVARLVRLAREHGIISVIDGAHPPGMMDVDMVALDPDFYATSPHKWLLAPQGTGILYIRADWRTRLWPTLASGDWDDLSLGAMRFNHLGSFDESRMAGLLAALRFHQVIGPDRIHERIRTLRRMLMDGLLENPRIRMMSPQADSLGAGMVSFKLDGVDALDLQVRLARAANIRTRVIGEYGYQWMRLSPHIYNSPAEIERVVALIAAEKPTQ
ncbi:MAG TPA: aminotransferase class V-fold PLP-dependent enzyme [Longimicrobiales bacterium]